MAEESPELGSDHRRYEAANENRIVQGESQHRYVVVDGIKTHYIEAGEGRAVVLLHSGEFGGCAELSWEFTIPALAEYYRVIAPDWLGYGGTDKLHDFGGGQARRLQHMGRFLEVMAVKDAAFIGNSMGGTLLAKVAASPCPAWPISTMVLASGGGFAPFNDARRRLVEYDGSVGGMRAVVSALFHDSAWAEDEAYVSRRHVMSLAPGAWEAVAAARFKAPTAPSRENEFGQPDKTPYHLLSVPTLIIAGADDQLREPGYADELQHRIQDAELHVLRSCGHLPQIEQPELFNELVLAFLEQRFSL